MVPWWAVVPRLSRPFGRVVAKSSLWRRLWSVGAAESARGWVAPSDSCTRSSAVANDPTLNRPDSTISNAKRRIWHEPGRTNRGTRTGSRRAAHESGAHDLGRTTWGARTGAHEPGRAAVAPPDFVRMSPETHSGQPRLHPLWATAGNLEFVLVHRSWMAATERRLTRPPPRLHQGSLVEDDALMA